MEKLEEARMNLAAIKSGAIKAWDWADIGKLTDNKGEPLTFDCIFNHRIGPNPEGYEAVTDAALNPGGYYIAFRDQGSISPEPVDKNFFHEDRYDDLSFSFEFRKKLLNKKH
jgi:hypothetical protein